MSIFSTISKNLGVGGSSSSRINPLQAKQYELTHINFRRLLERVEETILPVLKKGGAWQIQPEELYLLEKYIRVLNKQLSFLKVYLEDNRHTNDFKLIESSNLNSNESLRDDLTQEDRNRNSFGSNGQRRSESLYRNYLDRISYLSQIAAQERHIFSSSSATSQFFLSSPSLSSSSLGFLQEGQQRALPQHLRLRTKYRIEANNRALLFPPSSSSSSSSSSSVTSPNSLKQPKGVSANDNLDDPLSPLTYQTTLATDDGDSSASTTSSATQLITNTSSSQPESSSSSPPLSASSLNDLFDELDQEDEEKRAGRVRNRGGSPGKSRRGKKNYDWNAGVNAQTDEQKALTNEMTGMSENLKDQVMKLKQTLQADMKINNDMDDLLDQALPSLAEANQRLGMFAEGGKCSICYTWGLLMMICVVFVATFIFMRLFPKPQYYGM